MNIKAYAKLNLTLDIIGRRHDGYHDISSFMQTFSLHDDICIEISESGENTVCLDCKGSSINCEHDKNLCYRAAMLFLDTFGITNKKINITVDKRIPVEAGLGGGSTDGAAVVKLLAGYFNITDIAAIEDICLKLGADVPFFIHGGLQKAGGVGEKLVPAKRNFKYWVVVAKPEESVSSRDIYEKFDVLSEEERENEHFTDKLAQAVSAGGEIIPYIGNALQKVTSKICSEIGRIEREFLNFGAKTACMTGSGTAVFGLFDDYAKAVVAENYIKKSVDFSGLFEFI